MFLIIIHKLYVGQCDNKHVRLQMNAKLTVTKVLGLKLRLPSIIAVTLSNQKMLAFYCLLLKIKTKQKLLKGCLKVKVRQCSYIYRVTSQFRGLKQ